MKALPFHKCRMCRFDKNKKYVPIWNENDQDYQCEPLHESKIDSYTEEKLQNCVVSEAMKNNIFCYKCKRGFYLDWRT